MNVVARVRYHFEPAPRRERGEISLPLNENVPSHRMLAGGYR